MASRAELPQFVVEALVALGGQGTVLEVSRTVWEMHAADLESSGDLFFTWQYDIRWAAKTLRDEGRLVRVNGSRRGIWTLSDHRE